MAYIFKKEDSQNILIVDDVEMNLEVLSKYLEIRQQKVVMAKSGVEALEVLEKEKIDIVLLDYMMPIMNGYETLVKIKNNPKFAHIPVMMLSANSDIEKIVECIASGAEDYLTKPINTTLLEARLGSMIQKKKLRDLEIVHTEQLRKKQEEESRQKGLSSLFQILSGIGFEMNTPLNYIINFSETLIERTVKIEDALVQNRSDIKMTVADILEESAANTKEMSLKINEYAKKMGKMVEYMLSLSRLSSPEWDRNDINKLIDQSIFFVQNNLRGQILDLNVEVERNLEKEVPLVYVLAQNLVPVMLDLFDFFIKKVHALQKDYSKLVKFAISSFNIKSGVRVEILISEPVLNDDERALLKGENGTSAEKNCECLKKFYNSVVNIHRGKVDLKPGNALDLGFEFYDKSLEEILGQEKILLGEKKR